MLDISKQVKKESPEVQVVLFSATFPDRVRAYAKEMAPKANRLVMKKEDLTLATTQQLFAYIKPKIGQTADDRKTELLVELFEATVVGQSVIFLNRRDAAFSLSKHLKEREK